MQLHLPPPPFRLSGFQCCKCNYICPNVLNFTFVGSPQGQRNGSWQKASIEPQVGWHWICTGDVNPCLYVKCIVLKLKCFIQVSVSIYRGHIVLNLVKCTAVKFQPYVVFRENMHSTYLDICTRRLRRFCCGYECVIKYTLTWGVM